MRLSIHLILKAINFSLLLIILSFSINCSIAIGGFLDELEKEGLILPYGENPCKEKGSESWQKRRLEGIKEAIKLKIIMKVSEHDKIVFCYVDNKFYSLTFDEKQIAVDAILSYYYCKPPYADSLILYDGYSGKEVGNFSKYGLQMK